MHVGRLQLQNRVAVNNMKLFSISAAAFVLVAGCSAPAPLPHIDPPVDAEVVSSIREDNQSSQVFRVLVDPYSCGVLNGLRQKMT